MNKIAIGICILFSIGMAHADQGGEPNNTGCNGVGNINSPCEGNNNGGNGGNGGDGGAGGAGGAGGTGIGVGVGVGQGGSAYNYVYVAPGKPALQSNAQSNNQDTTVSTNNEQNTTVNYTSNGSDLSKRVPNHYAPSTNNSYNAYSCLKGTSGGISVSGFGGSLGGYTLDKNCDVRVTSSILMDYGLDEHAIQVLCSLPDMRKADEAVASMRGTTPRCHKVSQEAGKQERKSTVSYDGRELW